MIPYFSTHTIHVPGVNPLRDEIVQMHRDWFDGCIHEDPEQRGCMWNWLRAIRCAAINDKSEWTLTLSDDALPLKGWEDHLGPALANCPTDVLGLTHFGGYGEGVLKKGKAYGVGRNLVWGGAMAIRTSVVKDLARMAHTFVAATGYKHDDDMVTLFQMHRGADSALASRAIFGQPVKESLLGHNTPIRTPNATIENSDGPEWDPESVATLNRGSRKTFEDLLTWVREVVDS